MRTSGGGGHIEDKRGGVWRPCVGRGSRIPTAPTAPDPPRLCGCAMADLSVNAMAPAQGGGNYAEARAAHKDAKCGRQRRVFGER